MTRWWQVWVASLLCGAGLLGQSQPVAAESFSDKPAGAASVITPWKGPAPHVIIETDRGKLTLELYPDVAPRTVARFVELVQKGFYNGLAFHRVVPKFLIQGGDPAGNGTGGSGLPIPAEFSEKKHGTGTVGMARLRDPDSADSQFYICLEPQPFIDGKYTVFGQVVDGLDVLPKIQEGDVMRKVSLK
ncbi:MAG TPA: peptidylprolyl isomerase [Nitrospirales bacterium]|nr:peptidylprolyl isomerase [Nitrospirales bacterium]